MSQQEPNDGRIRASVAERAAAELTRLAAEPLPPGLYLVATPIGNLTDITLRALSVLSRAGLIYCEDTRHSRTLISHFGISAPLRPYHEHNAEVERPRILSELRSGKSIALISDAGTPLISDPGYKLVRDVLAADHHVESIPGPSALLTALTSSGLPTDAFLFAGFLPAKSAARRTRLAGLTSVSSTLIFYEAPTRVADTLVDMAEVLGDRQAVIARELTKLHEDFRRGTLADLKQHAAETELKGEVVLLVGPPGDAAITDREIADRLGKALETMRLNEAAKAIAETMGVPKSRVYDLGLKLKQAKE